MIRRPRALVVLALGWMIFLGACEPAFPPVSAPAASISPTVPVQASTAVLATYRSLSATPTPVSESAPPVCASSNDGTGVSYAINAVLDWPSRWLEVEQQVTYLNDTGLEQNALILYISANLTPDLFVIQRITGQNTRSIDRFSLEHARLTVPLDDPLLPGCETQLMLEYTLVLPEIRDGYRFGRLGYLGYSPRQVNLGMWLPLVAAFDPAQGWMTPPSSHMVGEQYALRTADFSLDFALVGAPDTVRVAGPGLVSSADPASWSFVLNNARDLTLSVAEDFRTLTTVTTTGVKVDLFYFPDPSDGTLDAPRHALNVAADALTLYEDLYGAYPYERFVVVEGDFPDGMEFSGLVFVSTTWFRHWKGRPNDWLTIITVHEVAHQWWYAMVGNDQGQFPYLDEALATFSEVVFFEHVYPEHVAWWWNFRVDAYTPSGYVDSTVYEFTSIREYINTVYLRGAVMMQALRQDLGDEAFTAWIQAYVQQMQGEIAAPCDLWGILSEDDYAATANTRQTFLRHADVLPQANNMP